MPLVEKHKFCEYKLISTYQQKIFLKFMRQKVILSLMDKTLNVFLEKEIYNLYSRNAIKML